MVGKLVPSESRLFFLQEDAHVAGIRKFSEADFSVSG